MSDELCTVCGKAFNRQGVWSGSFRVYEEECPAGEEGEIGFDPEDPVIEFIAHPDCMRKFVKTVCEDFKLSANYEGWPSTE